MHRQGPHVGSARVGVGVLFLPARRVLHGSGKAVALEKESCSPGLAPGPPIRPCGYRLSLGLLGDPGGPPISRVFTFCPTWGNRQAPVRVMAGQGVIEGEPRRGRLFWLCPHPRKMLVRLSLSLSDLPSPDGLSAPLRRDPADKPPRQPGCCAQQAAWTNPCPPCQTDDPNPARRRPARNPPAHKSPLFGCLRPWSPVAAFPTAREEAGCLPSVCRPLPGSPRAKLGKMLERSRTWAMVSHPRGAAPHDHTAAAQVWVCS